MDVSGQHHDQVASPPGKNPVTMEKEAGGVPEPVWTFWKRKIPWPVRKSNPVSSRP